MIDDNKISEKSNRIMQEIYCVENIDLFDIHEILIPIIYDSIVKHSLYYNGKNYYKDFIPKLIEQFHIKLDEYIKEKKEQK